MMNNQSLKNPVFVTSASVVSLLSVYTIYRYKSNIYNYFSSWFSSKK